MSCHSCTLQRLCMYNSHLYTKLDEVLPSERSIQFGLNLRPNSFWRACKLTVKGFNDITSNPAFLQLLHPAVWTNYITMMQCNTLTNIEFKSGLTQARIMSCQFFNLELSVIQFGVVNHLIWSCQSFNLEFSVIYFEVASYLFLCTPNITIN